MVPWTLTVATSVGRELFLNKLILPFVRLFFILISKGCSKNVDFRKRPIIKATVRTEILL